MTLRNRTTTQLSEKIDWFTAVKSVKSQFFVFFKNLPKPEVIKHAQTFCFICLLRQNVAPIFVDYHMIYVATLGLSKSIQEKIHIPLLVSYPTDSRAGSWSSYLSAKASIHLYSGTQALTSDKFPLLPLPYNLHLRLLLLTVQIEAKLSKTSKVLNKFCISQGMQTRQKFEKRFVLFLFSLALNFGSDQTDRCK